MKYIINKSPVNTTNNFNINDLKIDLEIPTIDNFKEFDIKNGYTSKTSIINNFTSKIGLTLDKAYNIDITIPKKIDTPIEYTYNFTNNDVLIDNINIIFEENSSADIIFKYISKDDNEHFHHLKLNVIMKNNSSGNISIVNLLNNNSKSLIAIETETNYMSELNTNLFDIGGNTKINNIYANTKEKSTNKLNNIYIGIDNDIIDMTYKYQNSGINSINELEIQGTLDKHAKKTFRGIIDFISGAKSSIGKENENCILLSDECISKSAPILLCGEEDVIGTHSVSSGKIDEEKLFYIMTKGLSKEEAIKLIIYANINKIIQKLSNEEIKSQIFNAIENKIQKNSCI